MRFDRRHLLKGSIAAVAVVGVPSLARAQLSVAMTSGYVKRRRAGGWTPLPFTVGGATQGFWARIVDNNGAAVAYYPSLADSAVGSPPWVFFPAGTTSATLAAPCGAVDYWRVKVHDIATGQELLTSNNSALCDFIQHFGHSIANEMLVDFTHRQDNVPPIGPADPQTIRMTAGVYSRPAGNGEIALCNTLRQTTGVNVNYLNTTFGESVRSPKSLLDYYTVSGTVLPGGCLLVPNVGADPWAKGQADLAAAGILGIGPSAVVIDLDVWDSNVGNPAIPGITTADYVKCHDLLREMIIKGCDFRPSFILVKPYSPEGYDVSAQVAAWSSILANYPNDTAGVDRSDVTYPDGAHPGGAAYNTFGARIGAQLATMLSL